MIEAAMIWNEPNNKSHWDFENDPGWASFARMTKLAGQAIAAEAPGLPRVLGGISPIDPDFIRVLQGHDALTDLDAVAVHGFPLDWNHWMLDDWPAKLDSIRAVTDLPLWVSEVGISTFGAEEVQEWGLRRTAELLRGRAPRIHWYSLYDLPAAWPATTRHREAELHAGGQGPVAALHRSAQAPGGVCRVLRHDDPALCSGPGRRDGCAGARRVARPCWMHPCWAIWPGAFPPENGSRWSSRTRTTRRSPLGPACTC